MNWNSVVVVTLLSNFLILKHTLAQDSGKENDRTLHKIELNDHLLKKVNDFIEISTSQAYDYLSINTILNNNILFLEMEKYSDTCVINLGTAYYVNKKYIEGYTKYRRYLIVCYSLDDMSSIGLISIRKKFSNLNKLRNYPDENSNIARDYLIEPEGWKMVIEDDGSLKIIYKGYL